MEWVARGGGASPPPCWLFIRFPTAAGQPNSFFSPKINIYKKRKKKKIKNPDLFDLFPIFLNNNNSKKT